MSTLPPVLDAAFCVCVAEEAADPSSIAALAAPLTDSPAEIVEHLVATHGVIARGLTRQDAETLATSLRALDVPTTIVLGSALPGQPPPPDEAADAEADSDAEGGTTAPLHGVSSLQRMVPADPDREPTGVFKGGPIRMQPRLGDAPDERDADPPLDAPVSAASAPPDAIAPTDRADDGDDESDAPATEATPADAEQLRSYAAPTTTSAPVMPVPTPPDAPVRRRAGLLAAVVIALLAGAGGLIWRGHTEQAQLDLLADAQSAYAARQYDETLAFLAKARARGASIEAVRQLQLAAQIGPLIDATDAHLQSGRLEMARRTIDAAAAIAPGLPSVATLQRRVADAMATRESQSASNR